MSPQPGEIYDYPSIGPILIKDYIQTVDGRLCNWVRFKALKTGRDGGDYFQSSWKNITDQYDVTTVVTKKPEIKTLHIKDDAKLAKAVKFIMHHQAAITQRNLTNDILALLRELSVDE